MNKVSQVKKCFQCFKYKSVTDFIGLVCAACQEKINAAREAHYETFKKKVNARTTPLYETKMNEENETKKCRWCFQCKPIDEFVGVKGKPTPICGDCREKEAAKNKSWYNNNKDKISATNAKSRIRKHAPGCIPLWFNISTAIPFYNEAQRLTKETGIQWVVDHIYPLGGDIVTGLHVVENLQVISLVENSRKNSKYPHDQPDAWDRWSA